jgi:hypothetical protein
VRGAGGRCPDAIDWLSLQSSLFGRHDRARIPAAKDAVVSSGQGFVAFHANTYYKMYYVELCNR